MPSPTNMGDQVGGGVGNTQIVGGKGYVQYSPQWYAAMAADRVKQAQNAGTAAGSGVKAAVDASGFGTSTGVNPGGGTGTAGGVPPRVGLGSGPAGTYTTGTPDGSGGSGGSPSVASVKPVDTTAANAAAFGRAKDQVGQTSVGALAGLRSSLASRGMMGSGAEYRGMSNVANEGQQQLGEVSRSNAINDAKIAEDTAFQNQNAALTGRGQDITSATSRRGQDIERDLGGYQGQITQRGQDINASMSAADRAQSQIASLMALLRSGGSY